MSQIYKSTASGPVPPTVATSYVTDSGTAVPAANLLDVFGGSTTANNANGIQTTGATNVVTVRLTNRLTGTVTTADATPTTVITFALGATPGVYTFSGDITAFDLTDTAGASYGITSGIRTTGAAATELGTQFNTNFEEAAMVTADVDVTVSGNNVIFQVTGIAGKTIDWDAFFTYRFVG